MVASSIKVLRQPQQLIPELIRLMIWLSADPAICTVRIVVQRWMNLHVRIPPPRGCCLGSLLVLFFRFQKLLFKEHMAWSYQKDLQTYMRQMCNSQQRGRMKYEYTIFTFLLWICMIVIYIFDLIPISITMWTTWLSYHPILIYWVSQVLAFYTGWETIVTSFIGIWAIYMDRYNSRYQFCKRCSSLNKNN